MSQNPEHLAALDVGNSVTRVVVAELPAGNGANGPAAGAGMNGEDGVPPVVLARQRQRELALVQLGGQDLHIGGDIGGEPLVSFGGGQLQEAGQVPRPRLQATPRVRLLAQVG